MLIKVDSSELLKVLGLHGIQTRARLFQQQGMSAVLITMDCNMDPNMNSYPSHTWNSNVVWTAPRRRPQEVA